MDKQRVIYRRWRKAPKSIIAILPDVPANPGRVMMYERIGQHGEGDPAIVYDTSPVCPNDPDVRALHAELVRIGYDLRTMSRVPRKGGKHG